MIYQAFAKAIMTGFTLAAEQDADNRASAIQSQEFWRAVRATRAQKADALQRGELAAAKVKTQASMVGGAQAAAYALAGVDTASGSAALVMDASSRMANLDAETLRANARREALGFEQAEHKLQLSARLEADARKSRDIARGVRGIDAVLSFAGAGMDEAFKKPKGGES